MGNKNICLNTQPNNNNMGNTRECSVNIGKLYSSFRENTTSKAPRTPASSIASLLAASSTVSSFSHPPFIHRVEKKEKNL